LVPLGLIDLHDDKGIGESVCDMVEKQIHHGSISPGQDQGDYLPFLGATAA
jgi:hypothetical protein